MLISNRIIKIQVRGEILSPKIRKPTNIDPNAPIPVQMGYAMLSGKVFVALASSTKLIIMPIIVKIVKLSFVKPWLNFIIEAQTTSNNPATIK